MKYLYLIFLSTLFSNLQAQDCLTLNYDNIELQYSKQKSKIFSSKNLDFVIPQEKNLQCIKLILGGKSFHVNPELNERVNLPNFNAYTTKMIDNTLITLLYNENGEKSIYLEKDNREIIILGADNGKSNYQVLINDINPHLKCGNELEGKDHEHVDVIENKSIRNCAREYVVEVGAAADYEFVQNVANGSVSLAGILIIGRFTGVATRYGDCDMRVIATLIDIVIEVIDDRFFNTPHCINSANSDAWIYNQRFSRSPNRPDGDVITLWTGQELRGALCLGDIGGMANLTGNVCDRRKTNVCQGSNGGSRLWTHEIGHNLGVGINHGNIPDGFFYGDTNNGDGPWHENTVGTIHGTIDNKSCVEKIDYCCTSFDDIYVCQEDGNTNGIEWCTSPNNGDDCIGELEALLPATVSNNGQVCGVLPNGANSMTVTVSQFTSLGCEFNTETFRVIDCGTRRQFPFTPTVFNDLCPFGPGVCFTADCVNRWIVTSTSSSISATTPGNSICLSIFSSIPRQHRVCVKPVYECGGIGEEYCWNINTERCDDDIFDIPFTTQTTEPTNKANRIQSNDISIFPNPVNQVLSIEGKQDMSNISMYNLNGKLMKSINCNGQNCKLEVSDLAPALYIIKIKDQAHEIVKIQKVIVQ